MYLKCSFVSFLFMFSLVEFLIICIYLDSYHSKVKIRLTVLQSVLKLYLPK